VILTTALKVETARWITTSNL